MMDKLSPTPDASPTASPAASAASPRRRRWLAWAAAVIVFMPIVLAVLFIAVYGWNWLRGPIANMATQKSGRVLAINGDLKLKWGWPTPRMLAYGVTFANPDWAKEKQMISSDAVEIGIDLPQLLRRNLVLTEVRLERPVVFLEQRADGRKNWLLDINQQDEDARIYIGRLTLDQGKLGYDDVAQKTSIRAELSTSNAQADATVSNVTFTAKGMYKGLALKASGSGGPVLALRDESTPYPLKVDATVGRTTARAEGTITSLLKFSAINMQLALSGDSLEQLYPLLGIAFPATPPYATQGRLVHGGKVWRYEKFSGRVGKSDIAGTLRVDMGGKRPFMKGELFSNVLDIADLGPLIGTRPGVIQAAKQAAQMPLEAGVPAPAQKRVLPDLPFSTERWNSVDADVKLTAKAIRAVEELPLENLVTQLNLRDSVLTLDPLNFGVAGGQVNAVVSLDGRSKPIQARAQVRARKIVIARLFPTIKLNQNSIGQINGEFDLVGRGQSVGQMLAGSNGKVGLVVSNGEISKLMMEKIGIHLFEILVLTVSGDKLVKLRCGVADFDVKAGTMQTNALIFDTEVTTILGTGSIDLAQEKLDLTLNQKTKNTSPLALRAPIYIRGSFANPDIQVDKMWIAARGIGAVALGLINPFLAIIPLIDPGPGKDSDCAQLVREARAVPRPAAKGSKGIAAPGR
jgi:uncharacterized protein involved in outer membrane biogenesis